MKRIRERCLYADVRYQRTLARWTVIKADDGTWTVNAPSFLDDPFVKPFPAFDAAVTAAHSREYRDLVRETEEPLARLIRQHQQDIDDGMDRVITTALSGGEHGVSVRTTFDTSADYGIRTTVQVDPDVPFGELRHYPVTFGGGEA